MAATVKCDTITNASNVGTANLALDASGNVTVGAGLTVTGALTGSSTVAAATGTLYPIVSGTVTTISGTPTAITYTGIPSWAKRIVLMYNGVYTSATSIIQIQLGTSGGFTTSGYVGASAGGPVSLITSGVPIAGSTSASARWNGQMTFNLLSAASNIWTANGGAGDSSNNITASYVSYAVPLSSTLTQIRLTTVNGTDTFTAGSVSILYE